MGTPLQQTTWEFRVVFDTETDEMTMAILEGLCEGVVRANMAWFNALGQNAPGCLSAAGVEYVLPSACAGRKIPCQTVRGAAELLEEGKATCIDIACYMAGYLRLRGTPARVVFENMRRGGRLVPGKYHVLVETPSGVVDYTQDLIDGDTGRCRIAGSQGFSPQDPSTFDPSSILAE
jgi:hypothetical protein